LESRDFKEVARMPIYKKDQKIVGYVIGEKVWCEYCWEEEKPEERGTPITVVSGIEKDTKSGIDGSFL
jgi:hypothetical protein